MWKRNEERNKQIEKYLKKGLNYQEIGDIYGVTKQDIFYLCRKMGLPSTKEIRRKHLTKVKE